MDVTFRTLGPWGPGLGRNLHPAEIDNNFWNLGQAIVALQNDPTQPNGIASISVSGTQMTIYLHDGSVMGPFTLPVLVFRWRGEWTPDTSYSVLDVFTVQNVGIFMVLIAHISGTEFDPNLLVPPEGTVEARAYQQLFGSTDAALSTLTDVLIEGELATNDVLLWDEALGLWTNKALGTIAEQNADFVYITGGYITGLPVPVAASDAATRAYVDTAVSSGSVGTIPSLAMLANTSIAASTASGVSLSNYLDAALLTAARGTLLYRGASGWIALAPGTSGQFLRTGGSGADPTWAVGSSGVTSITAGTGLATAPGGTPITAAGTIALASV